MYNLKSNNYHLKPKNSTIYTPSGVSRFIFELLRNKIPKDGLIFDPCCGKGNLLEPWRNFVVRNYATHGIDINYHNSVNFVQDFLTWDMKNDLRNRIKPQLILCNPPFNGYYPKLGSEVWLDKIIELFGKETPIVLFVPVGFCANLTLKSKRLEKFNNGIYPPIVSRITLPKNIFESVIFHSEILIFNVKGLEPHYFFKHYE